MSGSIADVFEGREEVKGITIDPRFSLCLDDAIWLEKDGADYVVHVSVTDISALVEQGSRLDVAAFQRGRTIHSQKGTKYIFPKGLSQDSLSLLEGQRRPTVTVSVPISADVDIGDPLIRRTVLRSSKQLTYQEADRLMGTNDNGFLSEAYGLAERLFQKRRDGGALVIFDRCKARLMENRIHNSGFLIHEFMMLANQVVARFFLENQIPGIYKNQSPHPDVPRRQELIRRMETALASGYQRTIDGCVRYIGTYLKRAVYGPQPRGHYVLGFQIYMNFTSPLRRYADVVNNRQLTAFLQGQRPPYAYRELSQLSRHLRDVETVWRQRNHTGLQGHHYLGKPNLPTQCSGSIQKKGS